MRAFVYLNPWPGVPVCIAGSGAELRTEHLECAAALCISHDFPVSAVAEQFARRIDPVEWARAEHFDVIITDRKWFSAPHEIAGGSTERVPSLFLVP
jgi:hypothetical protein